MPRDVTRAAMLALVMASACALAIAMTPRIFIADLQSRDKLSQIMPSSFGDWTIDKSIIPVAPSPDLQKVIDATYDETVSLTFKNSQGERVMLSLAYGRNQHKGMITHRPEVCYPAQGFKLTTSVTDASIPFHGAAIPVKRVVAAMGARNEPITYWVMVGNEITEFGYPHRWVAIRYGIRGEIPDGVLVRVSSVSTNNDQAYSMQSEFIQEMLDAIPQDKRHRLLGNGYQ